MELKQTTYNQSTKSSKQMTEQLIQARRQKLRKPFQSFTNIANRMEQVRIKNGITYINDSKAENVNATYFALQSIKKPVIWIAGGQDNQTNYWELMALVRQKVSVIIMIGNNNERLIHHFSPVISEIYEVNNMYEAVKLSYRISEKGTSVLLSPACKPDDKFADYQDRGMQFKTIVNKL